MKKLNAKLKLMIKKRKYGTVSRKILEKIYKEILYFQAKRRRKSAIKKCKDVIAQYDPKIKKNKRAIKKATKEMLYYKDMYGAKLIAYYMLGYNELTEKEVSEYVNEADRKLYLRYLNQDTAQFTLNKYDTYKEFSKYYKRDITLISGVYDYKKFEEFCSKHTMFVKKPHSSCSGRGVELIDTSNEDLKELFRKLVIENKAFIMEEKIAQDEQMAKLHPNSVNTIRMLPLIDKNGEVVIHKPFLKIGQEGSFVDNGGAGGILALIDSKTGKVISDGMDEMRREYIEHPNTNITFKGFQIPKWRELVDMMIEISKIKPQGRYLGWDVALSKKGWVVVECNSATGFIGQQMPMKKGIKKEFEELIGWADVPNKEQFMNKTKSKKKKIKRSIFFRIKRKLRNLIEKVSKKYSHRSILARKIYTNLLYRKYYKKHYDNIMKQINIYYSNHNAKETKECIKDMIYSKYKYGIIYAEYFMFKFAGQNHQYRSSFITSKERHKYLIYLNQNDFYNRFTDKYESYLLYKKYYKRELVYIKDKEDYDKFEQFCLKYNQIVKKPVDSSLGKGIELIDTKGKNLKNLFNEILKDHNEFILEERIKQGKEMAKLHPESVNTIRVIPFLKENGEVIIHYPFLKIGQNKSFVDNGGAGGILASVDAETGLVISDGIDEKMKVYVNHPNTEIKIKGFQLPDWNGVKKLANELVREIPTARYVGWDLAYTSKGWIVVEGNGKTMFVGQQMPLGRGIKKELEELIDWKNVTNKSQYKKN